MNKLKLIFATATCCLYVNLAFAPTQTQPKASTTQTKTPTTTQTKKPTQTQSKTQTTGEQKTMPQKKYEAPKKYGTPTAEQEKLLNSYLNPYAGSDLASTKRTAESKQATTPKNNEQKAITLIKEINLDPNYKLPAARDASRSNLIHLAVFKGYLELLKFLVENSADINIQNATKWTPLHIAAYLDAKIYKNKLEIVKFLVEHGASLDNKIADLPRPIDLVNPDCKLNFEIIKYLMDKMFKKPEKGGAASSLR